MGARSAIRLLRVAPETRTRDSVMLRTVLQHWAHLLRIYFCWILSPSALSGPFSRAHTDHRTLSAMLIGKLLKGADF